jgi:fructosamine-3-kinase
MNDKSKRTSLEISTAIIREHIDSSLSVIGIEPLHGGMVNRVEKWTTDGRPDAIVAKLSEKSDNQDFSTEYKSLAWYRQNTSFPVPAPYACISANDFTGTCLLMECAKGKNLGQAKLSAHGAECFQNQLAKILTAVVSNPPAQNAGSIYSAHRLNPTTMTAKPSSVPHAAG